MPTTEDVERQLLDQFRANPRGMLVQLHDGTEATVTETRGTAVGRQLRLNRPTTSGKWWIGERAVLALVYLRPRASRGA